MKTNFKFKNQLIAFAYVLLVAVFLVGCEKETPSKENVTINKNHPLIDKIEPLIGDDCREIHLYVIDSCEYIGYINNFHQDFLTHKGNCKFCLARNAK